MDVKWSPQQQAALDKAKRWLDAPADKSPQVHRIFGYAGTGKTTLARELAEHVGGGALSAAYTGKAASVLSKKGLPAASTVHRLIYTPTGNKAEEKLRELREELRTLEKAAEAGEVSPRARDRIEALRRAVSQAEGEARKPSFVLKSREESTLTYAPLLILDEVSMVPEDMALDLLSFGVRILCLGDPAQLPPVRGTGYFIDGQPDTLLTEVHRQAEGNPITRLATLAREGKAIPMGCWETEFGSARVVQRVSKEDALAASQILCGTNKKRQAINRRHRELGGHLSRGPTPAAGEKLVCLRNDHELGLLNGTLWRCEEDTDWAPGDDVISLKVAPDDGGAAIEVGAEASLFIDEDQKPGWGSSQWFTYGYCLTVHKSQGSEWPNVLMFDDWPSRSDSRRNWLYTGITRAAEQLTLVRD